MRKNVPNVLLDLFRDNFREGPFKWFREGDPILIPQSQMPALIISEPETDYGAGPTGHDEITHHILIQVVYNKKDEFGSPKEGSSLDATLDAICQGRDETTGDFLPNTIIGVLRKNITIGSLAIDNIGKVLKGIIPRSEELTTAEAHVEVTITELQAVAGRT